MFLKYQPLVDFLQSETGRPWQLVLEPTYVHAIRGLCSGDLTMALLGPYAYARARAACAVVPVAKLKTHGKTTYQGLIMVRPDSGFRDLKDLYGKRVGFGPPMSTASCLVARALLSDAGLNPGTALSCRHYLHHEQAARAVLLGEVDACAVRDIVGEQFVARKALRVLARSDEIPNFPLVLSPRSPPSLGADLVRILTITPAQRPEVAAIIRGWDEELSGGFSPVADGDYDPIRTLALRVFGPKGLTLSESALECPLSRP
jgi:phosphonate transport system substrate-binding protein